MSIDHENYCAQCQVSIGQVQSDTPLLLLQAGRIIYHEKRDITYFSIDVDYQRNLKPDTETRLMVFHHNCFHNIMQEMVTMGVLPPEGRYMQYGQDHEPDVCACCETGMGDGAECYRLTEGAPTYDNKQQDWHFTPARPRLGRFPDTFICYGCFHSYLDYYHTYYV